ncbi:MAG: biosynthetic-type acetolactate synthase large subunit [Clostridia bacterium]|jgi:acetolactate synthase-1/2/3 large subunit
MKMTGAQAIIKAFEAENVEIVFGLPGAAICPFYDAVTESKIKNILIRQEQAAVHAASGYARVTGKVGVCIATSGPGATNLVTGIATAHMDSIPIVAITGQVLLAHIGKDAFQEADITGATLPFTKHNYLVKDVNDIPRVIKEAFHIASTGRPGPVLIDIPVDVQLKEFDFEYPKTVNLRGYKPTTKGHIRQIEKVAQAIEKAKQPVILAGGGIITANASQELRELVKICNIPVTTTLMSKGCMPKDSGLDLGMLGSHGVYIANYAVNNADLIIVMGARVSDRAVGNAGVIGKKTKVIHIDIDPAEIGKNIDTLIPVVGDIKYILKELLKIAKGNDNREWIDKINETKKAHVKKPDFDKNGEFVNAKHFLDILSEKVKEGTIVSTEVGENQIWTANHFKIGTPRVFLTSGGLGTMGFGFPAAIGAKFAKPDKTVIAIEGDGSFQMNFNELGTVMQNHLGIKIVVFNNHRLGMVREYQKVHYNCNYCGVFLEENPDFVMLAKAYGFNGEKISKNSEIEGAIERMLADDKTYMLEIEVDPFEDTL